MPHDDQDARQLDNSSGICVIFNEPEKDEQLSPEWNLLVRSMWRFKPKGRRVIHSLLGFLILAGMPLYAGNAAQEKLEAKFLNRAVFIRGFYSNDDLTFDAQGKALRSPTSGPWSLALFEVQKLKIDKNRIRFEGFRAASVFDPETRKFKSVPLKKLERIRLTIAADTTSLCRPTRSMTWQITCSPAGSQPKMCRSTGVTSSMARPNTFAPAENSSESSRVNGSKAIQCTAQV